jgi:PAS domain-containing protein
MDHTDDVVYEVVAALADVEDVEPAELGYCLSEHVNPIALGNLFATPGASWEYSFEVPGHEVTVTSDGAVFVDGTRRRHLADDPPEQGSGPDRHVQDPLRHRRSVLEGLPCMLYRCQLDRRRPMEFVSEGCREVTGYDAAAFTVGGVTYGDDVVHPTDREWVWETVRDAARHDQGFSLSYRIRAADGGERTIWETGARVLADDGGVALVGLIARSPGSLGVEADERSNVRQR